MAAALHSPLPPAAIRRLVARHRPDVPSQSNANLIFGVALSAAFVILIVLLYNIIIGFIESLSGIFQ
jgi:hypothetical protein